MKTLMLATAAMLAFSFGVAQAQQTRQTGQPQLVAPGPTGGSSLKPNAGQGNDTLNPIVYGGEGSAKQNQRQGGNASSQKPQ